MHRGGVGRGRVFAINGATTSCFDIAASIPTHQEFDGSPVFRILYGLVRPEDLSKYVLLIGNGCIQVQMQR